MKETLVAAERALEYSMVIATVLPGDDVCRRTPQSAPPSFVSWSIVPELDPLRVHSVTACAAGLDSAGMDSPTIQIVRAKITRADLAAIAEPQFGDMVKAVVDLQRRVMAIGGELHSDEEALLLEDGATQSALWGINLYYAEPGESFVEFDSMINVRPSLGNRGRGVESAAVRQQILDVVAELVADA